MALKDWSTTAGSNTSVGGVSIAEQIPPANLNDGMRAIMADARTWYNGRFIPAGAGNTHVSTGRIRTTTF